MDDRRSAVINVTFNAVGEIVGAKLVRPQPAATAEKPDDDRPATIRMSDTKRER